MIPLTNIMNYTDYVSEGSKRMKINTLDNFKSISFFLIEQANTYEEGDKMDLGCILGDMNIRNLLHSDLKPAVASVWHDWEFCLEQLIKNKSKDYLESSNTALTKEQAFMAAFNFLDSFWESNHDVTLGEVIQVVERCIQDVESGIQNPVWNQWIQYVESEVGREYSFD